jgi:NADPH:quinone reductase-like Zn-dependent oxidoreductase
MGKQSQGDVMKAYVYEKKAKKLVLSEVDIREPKGNEVLVKICAVSMNAADYRSLKMGIVPKAKIYGSDISGIVEKIGPEVKGFVVGDEILADLSGCGMGGFAEYATIPETVLAHKPKNLTFPIAASLPMAAVTALQALRNQGKITKGESVLIYGASGGVGSFAVQLAKYFGCEVTGVCSGKNKETVKSLGADEVVDYQQTTLCDINGGFDLILAIHGGHSLRQYKKMLNKNGRLVVVGGELAQIFKALIFGPLLSLGKKKVTVLMAKPNTDDLSKIAELVSQGKIRAPMEAVSAFSQLPEVLEEVGKGHCSGKHVIHVI